MYQSIRPWLFRIDAEKAHNQIINLLHCYRHLAPVRSLTRILHQPKAAAFQWENLTFKNRVGLSAGFDKEASCFDELSDWGFGFIEVGTVTPEKVAGNPSPRIFRLPKDNALVSRTGFNNPGKDIFLKNLQQKQKGKYILGININTNHPDDEKQAQTEMADLYQAFSEYADYYTINWGSMSDEILSAVLIAILHQKQIYHKPVFLKLPADVPIDKLDEIISFAWRHQGRIQPLGFRPFQIGRQPVSRMVCGGRCRLWLFLYPRHALESGVGDRHRICLYQIRPLRMYRLRRTARDGQNPPLCRTHKGSRQLDLRILKPELL